MSGMASTWKGFVGKWEGKLFSFVLAAGWSHVGEAACDTFCFLYITRFFSDIPIWGG